MFNKKEFRNTGYFVREDGEIIGKTKILKKTDLPNGYQSVCLYLGNGRGNTQNYLVHRMVAECFLPNPENKPEVNHKNLNKKDNKVQNLEWSTSKENINHFLNLVERKPWEQPNSKVDEKTMVEIFRRYTNDNIYQRELSEIYNLDRSTISRIIKKMNKLHNQTKYV